MPSHENGPLRVDDFMDEPEKLQRVLEVGRALEFKPFTSGLFPASELSQDMARQTEMDKAWLRDNAHVGMALYESGRYGLAIPVGQAMLRALDNSRGILDSVVMEGSNVRLPVRFDGETLSPVIEERVQHDSTGYLLWLTSRLLADGSIFPTERVMDNYVQTVRYLKTIEYWHDPDAGHWEEDMRIHASSIGVVIAGLRHVLNVFDQYGYGSVDIRMDIQELIENGWYSYNDILSQGVTDIPVDGQNSALRKKQPLWPPDLKPPQETVDFFSRFNPERREYDAALLFLVEPLRVLNDEQSTWVVQSITKHLKRNKGFARYAGDTYWGPGFKEILRPTERTTAAEGRLELRNLTAEGVAYTQTEAQWTMFDPLPATHAGREYLRTGQSEYRDEFFACLNRTLGQLETQPDGSLRWPEAYYYEFNPTHELKFSLVPNDHTPLLWTQANVLRALKYFGQVARGTR